MLPYVSAFVFGIGLMVTLTKRHALFVLIGIELMMQAASFNFVLWSRYDPEHLQGQVFVLFALAMIACETAVALALMHKVYQQRGTIDLDELRSTGVPIQ